MKILINGKGFNFPSSLSEITLKQKIGFEKKHRQPLDEIIQEIAKQKDPDLLEAEAINYRHEKMIREFSFFTGITELAIREAENDILDKIASTYYSCLATIQDDEKEIELNSETEFVFNGELWELSPPEEGKTFGAFSITKKLIRLMVDISNGDWSAMPPICATYIRKRYEPFKPEFLEDGSDRVELMKDLPMTIVLQVLKFLNDTMNIYLPEYNGTSPKTNAAKS